MAQICMAQIYMALFVCKLSIRDGCHGQSAINCSKNNPQNTEKYFFSSLSAVIIQGAPMA